MPSSSSSPSLLSLTRSLVTAALLICPSLADPPVYGPDRTEEYDLGKMGRYPEIRYKTSDLVSPRILHRKWGPECNRPLQKYFICPRGFFVGQGGPMILDNDGHMVWHNADFKTSYGLTVQYYRSEPYLTFWTGNDQVIGHGQGVYYMYDKNYRQYKKLDAVGDKLMGDLHEFKITRENTALLTSYEKIEWDLSAHGRQDTSYIWDCLFQEMDIETNELLFEWRATDHFDFDDCYNPIAKMGAENNPWDWFHINSVDKDPRGNYLISARYSHSLSYIDGKTGKVLWQMGGKNNSFTDTSEDQVATNFAWQHDARWQDNYRAITLFDNAAYFMDLGKPDPPPARGLKLGIDRDKMEVKLLTEAKHPEKWISESQGSCQQLDNGNLLLGYGSSPAFTEFNPKGEIVCDIQFGALHASENGGRSPGGVMSYRDYQHAWKGYPYYDPSVLFENGVFYVSWNGATEVATWRLDGTNALGDREADWELVGDFKKVGFESNINIDEGKHRLFRLTALTQDSQLLGSWIVYSGGEIRAIPFPPQHPTNRTLLVALGAVITFIMVLVLRRRGEFSARLGGFVHQRTPSGRRRRVISTLNGFNMWKKRDDDVERVGLVRDRDGEMSSRFDR